jgi:N-acetylneuraminic acid mutarotase
MSPLYQWDKIKAEAPKARDSHTCVAFQDSLILFGGCGTGREQSFGDLNKFCIRNKCWTKLEVFGESPPAREAHICQVIGDLLLVHGGLNHDEDSFDDMWVLVGLGRKVDKLQAEMSMSTLSSFNPHSNAMQFQFNLRNNRSSIMNSSEMNSNQNEFLRWHKCE